MPGRFKVLSGCGWGDSGKHLFEVGGEPLSVLRRVQQPVRVVKDVVGADVVAEGGAVGGERLRADGVNASVFGVSLC